MLYVPWRKEPKDILGTYETYGIHFEAKQHIIEIKLKEYESSHRISQELLEQVRLDNFDTNNELATVGPNTDQREADDALQGPTDSKDYAFYQPTSQEHAIYDMSADIGVATSTAQKAEMLAHHKPDEDFLNSLSQLNLRQSLRVLHTCYAENNIRCGATTCISHWWCRCWEIYGYHYVVSSLTQTSLCN